ncbi:transglycosylase domain-containing protein [Umezawaea sp. NPDC059074]|uniref:transglycosylase domain-containing protein n=1 Tax=Umezawaea sp. NPDC059074 TaxID=3346716 RepID=UPI0036AE8D03
MPPPATNKADELTDLLQPVQPAVKREPDLLTHREPDEPAIFYGDEAADDEYEDEELLSEEEERRLRKKKIWRRVRRISYVAAGLMILTPVVAFAIAYQVVDVPQPADIQAKQDKSITLLYSDGSEMAKISPPGANREVLKPEEIPDAVKHAVFAAEDASFETNPGFDTKAIARAVWIQVTGGESGGSGLTQQYIKKATEDESPTLSRKFTEVVKAYKMNNQQSKDEILTAYLNTIYNGRSAFGFKAASQMYYKKDIKDLTPSESALIAGLIQNPSRSEDVEYATGRWKFVMGQMLDKGWISKQDYDTAQYPTPLPFADTQQNALEGVRAHIQAKVEEEMAKEGVDFPKEKGLKIGFTVHTTIDPKIQLAAEEAVNEVMDGQPEELKNSLSGIDPATGAVLAYWAGTDEGGYGIDYQTGTLQEPGSSFKPFDLVAALKKGKGLADTYDGTSPRKFDGREVHNSGDDNRCGKQCTIREAMRLSVNTVFYDMVLNDTNTQTVAEAAHEAGIPEQALGRDLLVGEEGGPPDANISIGGGKTLVRPFDMTSAYATFAARGTYNEPYFISKIEDPAGKLLYQHAAKPKPAFSNDPEESAQIADNVTEALKVIPKSSNIPCADNRDCAGKTGTHELPQSTIESSKAWMVGYAPNLAAGVWVGTQAGTVALRDKNNGIVFGSGLPGKIWQKFMDKALAQMPAEKFGKAKLMGKSVETTSVSKPPPTTTTTTDTTTTTTDPKDDEDNGKPSTTTGSSTTTTGKPPTNCFPLTTCNPGDPSASTNAGPGGGKPRNPNGP